MRRRSFSDEAFIEAVKRSKSWAEVFRRLDLKVGGGQYVIVKRLAKELNLSLDHMTGSAWSRGKNVTCCPASSVEEFFIENSAHSTYSMKNRLWREGLLEKKCYHCGSTGWFGRINHLQLEHINGDRTDNRLENLTILCANCHALTKTYCGKNREYKKKKIKFTWEELIAEAKVCPVCGFYFFSKGRRIFCSDTCRNTNMTAIVRAHQKKKFSKVCPVCKKDFCGSRNQIYCSDLCSRQSSRKVKRPSKEELLNLLKLNKGNFCAVARIFHVSDNAIRKWLRVYGNGSSIP